MQNTQHHLSTFQLALGLPMGGEAASRACPGCGALGAIDFFSVDNLPVHVGILGQSRQEALDAPQGDVRLAWCPRCELVHNRLFDLSRTAFKPGYDIGLQHSTLFRNYLRSVAERLIGRYDLHEKTVLEIGCGNGYFLRLLSRLGSNDGMGVDPTVPQVGEEWMHGRRLSWIRDFYCQRHRHLAADFICSLSMLEDVPRPLDFLRELRATIGQRRTPLYFEVFNAARAFAERETWSVHYEQCNYFSLHSLVRLFQLAGFEVTQRGECYHGQYIYVEAVPGERRDQRDQLSMWPELPSELAAFATEHAQRQQLWRQRLDALRRAGRSAVLWGSGGKGISFLNTLPAGQCIEHVVDINPERQGRFIPGSGQPIIAPERLRELQCDVIILTNRLYEAEIRAQVSALGLQCEFLFA